MDLPADFPSTHWTVILRAAGGMPADRRQAMEAFLRRYLKPMTAYLVRGRKRPVDKAEELVQGFVAGIVLKAGLLEGAGPGKGRFRTYLLKALNRYVVSAARSERRLKRGGGKPVANIDDQPEPGREDDPAAAFDLEWARALLAETVRRMAAECDRAGWADLWGVFEARMLRPSLSDEPPVAYADLEARYGLASATQASNVAVTARRMFARCLRAEVAAYVEGEADIDDEIADLRSAAGLAFPEDAEEPDASDGAGRGSATGA